VCNYESHNLPDPALSRKATGTGRDFKNPIGEPPSP
jgi:hypothetical protein